MHWLPIISDILSSINYCKFFRLVIGALVLSSWGFSDLLAQNNPYEIQLKSRNFTPQPGITENTRAMHSRALDQQPCTHTYIQFNTLPSQEEIQTLQEQGVDLIDYIGGRTYTAHLCQQQSLAFAARGVEATDSPIRWMGEIQPPDKVAAMVRDGQFSAYATQPNGAVKLRIELYHDSEIETTKNALTDLVNEFISESQEFKTLTVSANMDAIIKIAELDSVKWVDQISPPKTKFNDGIRENIGANTLQSAPFNLRGNGINAGIWDGGTVAATHPDFSGRLNVLDPASPDDHATHVAGTMGGDGENSQSQGGQPNQWRGVAPNMTIHSYDWDEATEEHNPAINSQGIDLSQNSWGFCVNEVPSARCNTSNCSLYGDYSGLSREYDQIVTGRFGKKVSVLFAAGNERDDRDCGMNGSPPFVNFGNISPPGTAKNIITVGAINSDNDSMTTFSSWGPTDDGRIKPEIVAPGCESGGEGFIKSPLPDGIYGGPPFCGTSMATPAASGTVALLLEQYRETFPGSDPLPSTVKGLLIHTAKDLENEGPDFRTGFGRIQAQSLVEAIRNNRITITEGEIPTNGHEESTSLSVPENLPELKVTLIWDDVPATLNSAGILINDLDLVLVGPGATSHFPWVLNPSVPNSPAQKGEDHTNIVEQVLVKNPIPGTWTIKVRGTEIPQPQQTYSLIATKTGEGETPSTPNVVGQTQTDAEAAIVAAGLTAGNVTTEHHPSIAEGNVIRQNPSAGTEATPGSPVDLVVSLGPPSVLPSNTIPISPPLTEGSISEAGMVNVFQFQVTSQGSYTMETNGKTPSMDTVMLLFDSSNQTTPIDENDDLFPGNLNSRIVATLSPGTYFIHVRQFHSTQIGDYTIFVQAQ